MKKRKLVRVQLKGEVSWAEHVEGNVYRSLNTTLTNVLVKLPADHAFAHRNGHTAQLVWGHLFEATEVRGTGCVKPTVIIGEDMTSRG